MLKTRNYLLVLFSIVLFTNAKATHNRAGEITYKWLFGYTYEIKITTYTNIGGTDLADRCEDTLFFGDGTKAVVLRSNGPIGSCAPAHEGVAINSFIKLNEYVTTHTYASPGNYKMSMEDPNRNAGILNISNSVNQVFYIESFLVIPTFGSGKNSSPVLTFPPIDNGCVGKCFLHNPGAYDIDGDSISYELTNCRGHLGVTCPGYTFPSTGGGTYNVNATTGTLTWCTPQLQGAYNLAMIIREWRKNDDGDYFLVGYILRDLQVDVGPCNNNPPNILSITDTCVLAGRIITNTITATDPDNDFLTLEANGWSFNVASSFSTFSSTPGITPRNGIFTWQTNYSHVRRMPYQVTIKVKDTDPSISLVDFKTFNVKVIPDAPINLTTGITNNFILLNWNKPTFYSLTGPNPFLRYKVYRKTGLSNWTHSSFETAPPAYTGFVSLGVNYPGITDTTFTDYNSGSPFIIGQDYSYVVLAEYSDGSTSYVSNISSGQYFVGINELSMKTSDITIFPNPVNENFSINFKQTNNELFTIELMDVFGRKLKTLLNNEALNKQDTLNFKLDNLSPGIYFLKIIGNHNTAISKKIIKQ